MSRWHDDDAHEQLDDEEIARILQEEEYEIARQRQREQQQRAQQPQQAQARATVPTSQAKLAGSTTDEVLLLQSRCSAVSGTTVLNGSCYLYRNLFKFVCVERGKEVAVVIFITSIEFINPVYAPKTPGVPRVVPNAAAEPNVIQIYTEDKRIHTFFNFADGKTFQKFYNILNSIHKNHTASPPQVAPIAASAAPPVIASSPAASGQGVSAPLAVPAPVAMSMPPAIHPMMYPPPPAYPCPPQIMYPPPHGYPIQLPAQGQPQSGSAPDHSQPQPQPQPLPPPYYYYPFPMPAPVAAPAGTESASPSVMEGTTNVPPAVAPYPYYYPPAPYPFPAEPLAPSFAAPYPYSIPATVPQGQPATAPAVATPPQQQQPQPQPQPQPSQVRPSGPPEDLLA